jgi:hypothetical protein
MAGETGGIGQTPIIPQQPVAVADATRVARPVVPVQPLPQQADPASQPTDQTQVAQTGSANTQVALMDQPQQDVAAADHAAAPLQPAVEEPDLPSPAHYSFRNTQVIGEFRQMHGRLLPGRTGEQMAGAVLAQLGIDPGDQSAVVRLQRKIGAYPDGKFGPETWGKALAYLSQRSGRGDAAAHDAMSLLLTPTRAGGRPIQVGPMPPQPPQPDEPLQPPEPLAPAELTETEVRQALDEPANTAMEKQLDDASWFTSDDVARRNMTNPAALFVMRPQTVAKNVKAMMSGWTSGDEKKAIMTGLRAQAATGNLGATLQNLDVGDLKGELDDDQVKELQQLAADPNSGVTAEQRQKLGS